MYKGIVFDLDGTLVDSPLCFKSIRKQLDIPEGEWILEYLETLSFDDKTLKLTKLEQIELDAAKKAEPNAEARPAATTSQKKHSVQSHKAEMIKEQKKATDETITDTEAAKPEVEGRPSATTNQK